MEAFDSLKVETPTAHSQKVEMVSSALRTTGAVRIKALGTSMLPTIWPGDILVIEAVPRHQLVCGEIVAVQTPDGIRAHRLVANNEPHWITRGDAMPQSDPAVSFEDVMGRVSEIQRGPRIVFPEKRLWLLNRVFACLLRSSAICRIALRLRLWWINRRPENNTPQPSSHKLAS